MWAKWLIYLLHDLGINHLQLATLYCDNKLAIHIAENPIFYECTKHIELDYHFICEKVQSKIINLLYVPSSTQLGDVFTKALSISSFQSLIGKLGVHSVYTPACGGLLRSKGKKEREKEGRNWLLYCWVNWFSHSFLSYSFLFFLGFISGFGLV